MQEQIKLPNIGDFGSVDVIEVCVAVGDVVETEQTLVVLETEKATMDIPSPMAGKVTAVSVSDGDKISEGQVIVHLEVEGSADEPIVEVQSAPTAAAVPPSAVSSLQAVTCPDIGDFAEVDVIEVPIQVGDHVELETPLLLLETEKATMEIPSPYAGIVREIKASAGEKISQNHVICLIETTGGGASTTQAPAEAQPAAPQPPVQTVSPPPQQLSAWRDEPPTTDAGIYAGPAVRRLARELEVPLKSVSGTGPKGRVTKEDLHNFVKRKLKGQGGGPGLEPMPDVDFSKFGEVETKPLSRINKLSAKFLHRNWVNIPHVTQFDDADITDLEAFRQENKKTAMDNGIRLTALVFIMKAVVTSLRAFPRFNTSLTSDGASLIQKHYFHIGFAVDTPNGLVVPVIRDVNAKSVFQCAREVSELSLRAREGQLKAEDMQGSSFTISSLGGIGGTAFTPIINAPDVAILGVSRSALKPVWQEDRWVPRLMLPLSLSYDHRVIDGALAARFITHLNETLSCPKKLILS